MSVPRRKPLALSALFSLSAFLAVPDSHSQPSLHAAWIKDRNQDGTADQVHLRFAQVPAMLPYIVAAAWSEDPSAFREAAGSQLTYAPGDSTHVVVDFPDSVFTYGLTGVPAKGAAWVQLPPQGGLPAQNLPLEDSVPPILLAATFHPGPSDLDLDTLRVTVSEPLKPTDLKSFLRYSAACADPGRGAMVTLIANPAADWDGTRYLALVNRSPDSPRAGGCLALNGPFITFDLAGNAASERKVPLRAPDPLAIRRLPHTTRAAKSGPQVRADGRRIPPTRTGSAPRGRILITFQGDPPQEGPTDDHSLGHPEP